MENLNRSLASKYSDCSIKKNFRKSLEASGNLSKLSLCICLKEKKR